MDKRMQVIIRVLGFIFILGFCHESKRPPEKTNSLQNAPEYQVTITAEALNIRANPEKGSKVLAVVKRNQIFHYLGEENGWGKIKLSDGRIGFAGLKFLEIKKISSTQEDLAPRRSDTGIPPPAGKRNPVSDKDPQETAPAIMDSSFFLDQFVGSLHYFPKEQSFYLEPAFIVRDGKWLSLPENDPAWLELASIWIKNDIVLHGVNNGTILAEVNVIKMEKIAGTCAEIVFAKVNVKWGENMGIPYSNGIIVTDLPVETIPKTMPRANIDPLEVAEYMAVTVLENQGLSTADAMNFTISQADVITPSATQLPLVYFSGAGNYLYKGKKHLLAATVFLSPNTLGVKDSLEANIWDTQMELFFDVTIESELSYPYILGWIDLNADSLQEVVMRISGKLGSVYKIFTAGGTRENSWVKLTEGGGFRCL